MVKFRIWKHLWVELRWPIAFDYVNYIPANVNHVETDITKRKIESEEAFLSVFGKPQPTIRGAERGPYNVGLKALVSAILLKHLNDS